jgi:hypothetical protein
MKLLKYVGFLSLISSYVFLIISLLADLPETTIFNFFYIAWGLGILSLVSNTIYAIKLEIKSWIFSIFGFCGLIWLILPFVNEGFGIVSLIIFLIIGIYIHLQKNNSVEKPT